MPRYVRTLPIVFLWCAACSTAEDPNKHRQIGPRRPPAQTSLFFIISQPDAGMGCEVNRQGYVANIGGPPKSSSGDPGVRLVDGEDFARIRCRIAESGGGTFNLTLSAEKAAATFSLIDGTVTGASGSATISMAGTGTGAAPLSGACQLDLSRQPFEVGSSHIWASFTCPSVSSSNQPGAACQAQGEFIFENCDP